MLRCLAERSARGWGGIRSSKGSAEIARELCFSEARVALALKKMGQMNPPLCRATSDRSLQIRYVITDAGEARIGWGPPKLPSGHGRVRRWLGV